jgi:hypothetical protein
MAVLEESCWERPFVTKRDPLCQICSLILNTKHFVNHIVENRYDLCALLRDALAVPHADGGSSGSADFLRFGCSQLVVERIDPLVNPGLLPSPHMHQIVGGNSFNISMDPDSMDPPKISTCRSCMYFEDTSNYWTASIYFKSPETESTNASLRWRTGDSTTPYSNKTEASQSTTCAHFLVRRRRR